MVSTFSPNKGLELPSNNSYVDTWDAPVNADWTAIDIALGGSTLLNATGLSGNVALTLTQYRPFALLITGAPTAALNYVIPAGVGGFWSVFNGTTGGFQISVGSGAGGSAINIPVGTSVLITCDGSASGMRVANTPVAVAGGTTTQVQYNSSGILAGSANFTFDGTTIAVTGLNVGGNTVLGLNSGSTLLLNGTAVSAPNGLNINTGALFLTGTQLGVGTTMVGSNTITAVGTIKSLSGGFVFPDGTTQTTAAGPVSPGGANTNVQFNDGGLFGGVSAFSYNKGTGVLTAPIVTAATVNDGSRTGICEWFAGPEANIPSNSLSCYGQAVSRTGATAPLFAKIGTTWGVGDGSTTYNLPDFRGRAPFGADNQGGASAGRLGGGVTGGVTGAAVPGATGGQQNGAISTAQLPSHTHGLSQLTGNTTSPGSTTPSTGGGAVQGANAVSSAPYTSDATGSGGAFNTTPPANVGVWIIWL